MVISRAITRVTPVRALITLLITYLLSPLPLQVGDLIISIVALQGLEGSFKGFCVRATKTKNHTLV